MSESIGSITTNFGSAYWLAKETGELRDEYQKAFFEAATEEVGKRVLAQKIVEVPSAEDAAGYIGKHHPGWRLNTLMADGKAYLEEDPALLKYTYVNADDGYVYGRTVTEAAPYLDLDAILAEDPQLYDEITEWPAIEMVNEILVWAGVGQGDALPVLPPDREPLSDLLTRWGFGRQLRDLNTVEAKTLAKLEKYWVPGKVSVRLVPPRKAKPEELEG